MVELVGIGRRAKHRVTQAFAMRKLAEDHAQKLLPTSEMLDLVMTIVTVDTCAQTRGRG